MATALLWSLIAKDQASPAFLRVAAASDKTAAATARAQRSLMGASGGMAAATTSSNKLAGALKGTLVGGAKLAGVFGAFELAKKAIDVGKEASVFEKNMTLIRTQAGASGREVKNFSTALLSMSGRTAAAPAELATSLYHVYSVGLRSAKALNVVEIAAKGARIGNADLEETTNALTSTVASGIKGANNMAQAMGALNTIVGAGDMKLSDLNDALAGGILTSARSFGIDLKQVGAALAVFGDNNVRGADAATQLRMSIMALAMPVQGGAHALAKIGVSASRLRDDMAKGGLTSALDDLTHRMKVAGITGNKVGGFITEAFGRKAGIGLSTLVQQAERYHLKLEEVGRGADNFGKSWQATTKTTSFAFSRLGALATAAGISIANGVLPPLTKAAAALGRDLPSAIHAAAGVLTPFGGVVSTAFGAAWTVAGAAITVAAGGLKLIGSALNAVKGPLTIVGTLAASAFLGFKAVGLISGLIETLALKMLYAKDAIVGLGVSAQATATRFVGSSTVIAASAETTAGTVAASGEAASVGWAGVLGPLAGVALGVGLLISSFAKSKTASKQATEAAKSYAEVLSSGGSKADLFDTITKNLKDNGVPKAIGEINKGLSGSRLTGKQFVTAITASGKPLKTLRSTLEDVVKAETKVSQHQSAASLNAGGKAATYLTDRGKAAAKALNALNSQFTGLSKATRDDLLNTKAFAGVSSSIDKVALSSSVGSDAAKAYAQMLGITVDKNGVAAVSAKTLSAAVTTVSDAYNTASGTGSEYLSALASFSQSQGTAADRAALIGATLKANAGDALNFASQMNATAVASKQMGTDIASAASSVGKTGISTKAFLKSVVDLKTGTINYSKAAAAPLISNLQSIQSAAINAASATYQNNLASKGGKKAADMAIAGYKGVEDSLVGQLHKLGMSRAAARKLTEQYLGVPKNVKTLIEQAGANPVVNVLNKIGTQLAYLTGHPWEITTIHTDVNRKGKPLSSVDQSLPAGKPKKKKARGGVINGPGTGTSDTAGVFALSNGEAVIPAKAVSKHRGLVDSLIAAGRGLAKGGVVSAKQDAMKSRVSAAISGIGQASSPPFSLADVGADRLGATIAAASRKLDAAIRDGLSKKTAASFRSQIRSLVSTANKQLTALRVKVRGSDITDLKNAFKKAADGSFVGSVDDARTALSTLYDDMKKSRVGSSIQSAIKSAGSGIISVRTALDGSLDKLSTMKDYASSIGDTLRGAFDPTQSGSITDLLAGFSGATGANTKYSSEVSGLLNRSKGDKTLTGFINQLATSGNSATLETLAGASKSDLANVSKAVAGYNTSVSTGADAATTGKFGATVAQQQAVVNAQSKQIADAVSTMAEILTLLPQLSFNLEGRPIDAKINHSVKKRLDTLTHQLQKGRH